MARTAALEGFCPNNGLVAHRRARRRVGLAGVEEVVEQASGRGVDHLGDKLSVVPRELIFRFRRYDAIRARREEDNARNKRIGQYSKHKAPSTTTPSLESTGIRSWK